MTLLGVHRFKFLLVLLTILTTVFINTCYAYGKQSPLESPNLLKGLNDITNVYNQIQKYYVKEVEDKTIFENSIKGMLESLDPYSVYFTPDERKNFFESVKGKFGGIGIVIGEKGDLIQIISPIDDTPGYRAGLQEGDLILKIYDQQVSEISLQEGVKLMRGLPGTKVKITIMRSDQSPFELEIEREIITITSVKGYLLEDGIAYIRISHFQEPSTKLLKEILEKLKIKNKGELNALILDLRNNPGGMLMAAVNISDIFIDDSGIIVYTEGRAYNSNKSYYAKPGDIINGVPMVTLINKGSASASEILAGALQDYKRSIIMGQNSFGKGSVQSMIDTGDGYGIKLTTAYFYTPSGNVIQENGIKPDIVLEKPENKIDDKENDAEEQQNSKLLPNVDPSKLNEKEIIAIQEKIKTNNDKKAIELLKQNYGIQEALNYLKEISQVNKI